MRWRRASAAIRPTPGLTRRIDPDIRNHLHLRSAGREQPDRRAGRHRVGRQAKQHELGIDRRQQGRGLGEVLMTSALDAFRKEGLATASLSVTFDNRRAYRLYQRLGFGLRKEFAAHAWVRPPARIELPA